MTASSIQRSGRSSTLPVGKLPAQLLATLLRKVAPQDPGVMIGPGVGWDCAVVRAAGQRGDAVTLEGDVRPGKPFLQPVMQNGQRLGGSSSLSEMRTRVVAAQVGQLAEALLSLETSERPYGVLIAESLQKLANGLC
jgi:hypothetical protein